MSSTIIDIINNLLIEFHEKDEFDLYLNKFQNDIDIKDRIINCSNTFLEENFNFQHKMNDNFFVHKQLQTNNIYKIINNVTLNIIEEHKKFIELIKEGVIYLFWYIHFDINKRNKSSINDFYANPIYDFIFNGKIILPYYSKIALECDK